MKQKLDLITPKRTPPRPPYEKIYQNYEYNIWINQFVIGLLFYFFPQSKSHQRTFEKV